MARSPLFDIYDPYGTTGAERIEDLLPEEEKAGLLRRLANMGSSGLSAFGWLLDTPGAFIRGTLAGDPLSVFGDSERRVTGRELLRQYGLAGEEDTWGNFGGGLATEILLDPLTYASLGLSAMLGQGSKTAAYRAAAKAGLTPDDLTLAVQQSNFAGPAAYLRGTTPQTLIKETGDELAQQAAMETFRRYAGDSADELLQQPLARSHRVGLPFTEGTARDLFGEGFGDWAAQFSDRNRSLLFNSPVIGPAMRSATAMFDHRVKGLTDPHDAAIGRTITAQEVASDRLQRTLAARAAVNAARNMGDGVFGDEFARAVVDFAEGQGDRLSQEMWDLVNSPEAAPWVEYITNVTRDAPDSADRLGLKFTEASLPNDIAHFPRQMVQIDSPRYAPGYEPKRTAPPRGSALADTGQGHWAQRDLHTRAFPRWVLDAMNRDGALQDALRNTPDTDVERVINDWVSQNAVIQLRPSAGGGSRPWLPPGVGPYDWVQDPVKRQRAYINLADSLRRTPLQAAAEGFDKYGNSINDIVGYAVSMGRRNATADVLLNTLARDAEPLAADVVPGGAAYTARDALQALGGFDATPGASGYSNAELRLAERMDLMSPDELANYSWPKSRIEMFNTRLYGARAPREAEGLVGALDKITDVFKTLALSTTSRHPRDAYSGLFASATQGGGNVFDFLLGTQVGGGNYRNVPARIRDTPAYRAVREEAIANPSILTQIRNVRRADGTRPWANATDDEVIDELVLREFLADSGGLGLTQQTVGDELGRQAQNLTYQELYPGGSGGIFRGVFNKPMASLRTWNPFQTRGRSGRNPNVLLDLSDRVAEATDAGNRIGTYINRIAKGDSPLAAKRTADLTQILYGNDNFTQFERDVMTRVFPFYRFTRGITPLVFQELTENPAGLMGQSIRTVNRLGEPTPDRHVPEHMRASAAIAIDPDTPLLGSLLGVTSPGVTRFLTNVDLPQEGLLNLFTPGVGNSYVDQASDALSKFGRNLLGQTNPLIKGPIEMATGQQFYTGRQLNDLYSVLQDMGLPFGRTIEQVVANAPGGSRLLNAIRTYRDTRISPQEKAAKFLFNSLTGAKFQDVDQDRTVRLAARTMLNDLLDAAPGVSTFENLYVKPEDLVKLSPEQQQQYLLYRALQSEAARRNRERKAAADDPLSLLGVR